MPERTSQTIVSDSRVPTIEIAKKLNSSTITIKNRIKKLMKSGVIQGFKISIDPFKIGYQFYKVDIELNEYQKIHQIINYIKNNPNLTIIGKSIGFADLELRFHVRNLSELHQIMNDITVKFPDVIKNYKYFYTSEIFKMNYMPKY